MKLQDITSELDNFEHYTKLVIKDPFSIATISFISGEDFYLYFLVNEGVDKFLKLEL